MKTSEFDYDLPSEFIAQTPVEPRDSSRLLVLDRAKNQLTHTFFNQVGQYLKPGDLLVVNETKVIQARLFAQKATGGRIEILLLREMDATTWEVLIGGKGVRNGSRLQVEDGPPGVIVEALEGARRIIQFDEPIARFLPMAGHVPLPPYIHEPLRDPDRYQTIYARSPGSAAAPTAGLHFTPALLNDLRSSGIELATITLHVGLDTFSPVTEEDPTEHLIHSEWCEISQQAVNAILTARARRGRIIATGTTTVRCLESAQGESGITAYTGNTRLFILPGYTFTTVDAMITNFHLPRSTLIMLVSAFAGRERILEAYESAKQEGYRFYSFGDAMLIL